MNFLLGYGRPVVNPVLRNRMPIVNSTHSEVAASQPCRAHEHHHHHIHYHPSYPLVPNPLPNDSHVQITSGRHNHCLATPNLPHMDLPFSNLQNVPHSQFNQHYFPPPDHLRFSAHVSNPPYIPHPLSQTDSRFTFLPDSYHFPAPDASNANVSQNFVLPSPLPDNSFLHNESQRPSHMVPNESQRSSLMLSGNSCMHGATINSAPSHRPHYHHNELTFLPSASHLNYRGNGWGHLPPRQAQPRIYANNMSSEAK